MQRSGPILMSLSPLVIATLVVGTMVDPRTAAAAEPVAQEAADERVRRERVNELMAQGEAHRAAGRHVEAAGAYAAAFDVLAERERPDADERLAVNLAVDELVLAQAAESESLTLVEEEAALLRRYEQRHGGLPPGLAQELARVTSRIEALRPKEPEDATESVETTDLGEPAPGSGVDTPPTPPPPKPYPPEPPPGKHLFAAGVVVTAATVAMRSTVDFMCVTPNDRVRCPPGRGIALSVALVGASTGMGLLGAGAARWGKWRAHGEVARGDARTTGLTTRERLGWVLFGAGMAWWVASRTMSGVLFSRYEFLVYDVSGVEHEGPPVPPWIAAQVGWSTGVALAATGLALALHGRAYRRSRPGFEHYRRPKIAMMPSLSLLAGGGVVAVSGRF